jgi:AraC-like DNA-binding protein
MVGLAQVGGLPLAGQSYLERRPGRALGGLVSSVWVQRVAPDAPPYVHRAIPNGSVEFRCRPGAAVQIVGPLTRPLVEVLPPGSMVMGVRFYPGAAAGVLGVPPSEFADLTLDAGELWGRRAAIVGERVAGAATPQEAVALLQELIAARRADATAPDLLVAEAVHGMMPWRVGDLGSLRSSLYVSERQFRRRCESAVGVAPKALQRMLRFQGFLAQVQFALSRGARPAGDGLARLATGVGYADQSHLTRECLRLTGVTPRMFLRETEQSCGCGHDHEVSFAPLLEPRGLPQPAAV